MAFDEVRFPDAISRGARGGPQRRTQIVTLASGDEERNASWANSRRSYDAAFGIRRADDLAAVIAFFEARNGRLRGFRWKDWSDYKSGLPSAAITAFDQPLGTGDGTTTAFQLKKLYTSGGQTWSRTILKPVAGTVQAGILTLQGPELLSSGSNLQSATWSNTGALGANSAVIYGSFTAAYDLGTTGAGLRQHASVPVQQGKKYRAQVWLKAGGSPDARLNLRLQPGNLDSGIKGTFAAPTIFNQNGGAVSNLVITDLGGGFWLWSFDIVVGAGLTGCLIGAGNSTAGQIVTILGASLREPAWTGAAPGWTADMSTGVVTFLSPPSVGANLTAGFEFDVPVRFDTDDLPVTLDIERLTSSTEGAVIPNVYGRMKIGGNIFWATDFLEKSTTTTQGGSGKGGGGGEVKTTTYSYSCSFAVGLCEGPISGIGRIWADGKPFDLPGAVWRVYTGTETQLPDPFITAKMGAGNAPAYRGMAYVVFEELPLEKYGNRIPQLSFEVIRPTLADGSAESLIRAVNLIPGAGEFVYATETITRSSSGTMVPENQNSTFGKADLPASLDNLEQVAPNLESVSLVVSWFGTDLRAGSCLIQPGVETTSKTTSPKSWAVNGVTRTGAHLISQVGGAAAFGGTPADFAVVEAIQDLRARGKRITFYPFLMMDVPAGNALPNPYSANAATPGQPVYPWRGRITVSPAAGQTGTVDKTEATATQVAAFFGTAVAANFSTSGTTVAWTGSPSEWGYRRVVLHYAKLCVAAGGVDSFLIGSELRGLTTVRSSASTYPTVTALQTLAADCRAILGAGTKIGYAADWSEYFGHKPGDGTGDLYFHLDPLWADANIDFIGVDNYLPLSDWRDGTSHLDASGGWSGIHDPAYLQSNIEGGEYFDWFYASDAARNAQTRTPISDGGYGKPWVFRPKDFRNWWSNAHRNRPGGVESASATAWVPQSKPIRFTEIGCPAIDKGTNQPNVFFDPKSSESELPHFSSGARDDAIQRRYLETLIGYWSDAAHNPISTVYSGPMIDMSECAVWCWDARPYPAWPGRSDVWGDTANWEVGHWLNGRLGNASLGDLVRSICARSGIDPNALDVSRLADAVPGLVIAALESPRASIAPLARYFGFDAVESQGMLRFMPRGSTSIATITADDLVAADKPEGEDIEFTRGQETELPRVLKWRMLSADEDYEAVTVEARRVTVDSVRVQAEQFAIAHPPATADRNARRALFEAWIGRETATFVLPPSRLALDPTDVVAIENDGRSLDFALTQIADGEARRVEASRRDQTVYGLPEGPSRGVSTAVPVVYGPPDAEILDLPQLNEDVAAYRPLAAVAASPWYGQAAIWRSASLDGFSLFSTASVPAQFGTLAAALPSGPSWRFDLGNVLLVDIASGSLQSVTDEQLFAGANALALETAPGIWEVLQYGLATIVSTGRWKLTRLLRGQSGTEDTVVSSAPIGSRILFLNAALVPLPVTETELGMPWNWRIGPVSRAAGDPFNSALAFTPQGRGLRPWSPVRIKGIWQGSGDIGLTWLRRTRALAGDSWNAPEVPLGEASESYDLEILTGGGSVVRTVSGIGTAAWTYTSAMQAADFGGPVTSLRLRIFQNGQLGRGAPAETTLTP